MKQQIIIWDEANHFYNNEAERKLQIKQLVEANKKFREHYKQLEKKVYLMVIENEIREV